MKSGDYMQRLFQSKRFKAFLAIIAALLVGVILSLVTSSHSSPASSLSGYVLKPVQKLSAFVSEKMLDFSLSFRSSNSYRERIDELEAQIAQYEKELVDYEQTKHKLESYQSVLGLKEENPDYELLPADIIGRDSLDVFNSFMIDKGSADGVKVNDPVVYGSYVVGVVHSVKRSYSVVWTVFNPKVNISAYETRTREAGYSTTTTELALEGKCLFSGLDKTTNVAVGGQVCTSGLGRIYPKGLIIGKITEITDSTYNASVNAVIEPVIDLTELEDVFVITDFDEQDIADIDDDDTAQAD